MPLVASSKLTQPREIGGLGLKNYMTHVDMLLSRWVEKALNDTKFEWATIFITLLGNSLGITGELKTKLNT